MKKIYVAASFAYADREKTEERKAIIKNTVEKIKSHLPGDYYLPQELKIENAWDYSLEEWGRKVFEADVQHLKEADTIIFISFGKENNAGSVWEIGFAAGMNDALRAAEAHHGFKEIIMVKMSNKAESLMITNSVNTIITEKEIDTYDWHIMPWTKTDINELS